MSRAALLRGLVGACFVVAGVVGCAPLPEAGDASEESGPDPRELPDLARFRSAECDLDELRERVCGGLAAPVDRPAEAPFWDCPEDPKQLTSVGPAMLFYTDTKKLEFDRRMTLRYREEKNANCGEEGPQRGQCCYSRCTPLPVAPQSTRGVPEGFRERTRCVDAPQTGTRQEATEFPDCPNALAFGVGPSPFEADPFDAAATSAVRARPADFFSDVPRCCYRTLEPTE